MTYSIEQAKYIVFISMSDQGPTSLIIEATPVTFPFPPYKQQIEYMTVFLKAMK